MSFPIGSPTIGQRPPDPVLGYLSGANVGFSDPVGADAAGGRHVQATDSPGRSGAGIEELGEQDAEPVEVDPRRPRRELRSG